MYTYLQGRDSKTSCSIGFFMILLPRKLMKGTESKEIVIYSRHHTQGEEGGRSKYHTQGDEGAGKHTQGEERGGAGQGEKGGKGEQGFIPRVRREFSVPGEGEYLS